MKLMRTNEPGSLEVWHSNSPTKPDRPSRGLFIAQAKRAMRATGMFIFLLHQKTAARSKVMAEKAFLTREEKKELSGFKALEKSGGTASIVRWSVLDQPRKFRISRTPSEEFRLPPPCTKELSLERFRERVTKLK
jgi:hypothetical protein